MKFLKSIDTKQFYRVITGLMSVGLLSLVACNNNSSNQSSLTVAGGTIDSTAAYRSVAYAEMNGVNLNGTPAVIKNVANFVNDPKISDSLVLIMSLADGFGIDPNSNTALLPVFKTLSLKVYFGSVDQVVEIKNLNLQPNGKFLDAAGNKIAIFSVGIMLKETGTNSSDVQAQAAKFGNAVFMADPLLVGSTDLRSSYTSFVMMTVPKSLLTKYLSDSSVPTLAGSAPAPSTANLVMVGYGPQASASSSGSPSKVFALSNSLPGGMVRNYAKVSVLSDTGLSKFFIAAHAPGNVIQQLYEIGGSGICGSLDGISYDTGAGIIMNNQLYGIAVRTTSISSGYLGRIPNCNSTPTSDMATLVVSPTMKHLEGLESLYSSN